MQTHRLTLTLVYVVCLAVIAAGSPGAAMATTTVASPTYTVPTTWTLLASPYVVTGTVRVGPGGSLTIEPGVVVKFRTRTDDLQPATAIEAINGPLLAEGTPGNRIVFTSERDDHAGGDTNGDGSATTPDRGDWQHLYVKTATFDYVDVRYGGAFGGRSKPPTSQTTNPAESFSGIWVAGNAAANVSINNSRITDNKQTGIGVGEGALTLQNSLVARNHRGIAVRRAGQAGTLDVYRTTIRDNGALGMYFIGNSLVTGEVHIHDSNITRNKDQALWMYPATGVPAASIPYGENNNIYDNRLSSPDTSPTDISIGTQDSFDADWTLNFWGADIEYTPNNALACQANHRWGRLLDHDGNGPGFPVSQRTQSFSGTTCIADTLNTQYPLDHYIDNHAYDDFSSSDGTALLYKHAPLLAFDQFEVQFPMKVDSITDNYEAGVYTNQLQTGASQLMAVSDPALSNPAEIPYYRLLRPDLLGAEYADGLGSASASDFLDEASYNGADPGEDGQRLYNESDEYRNWIYGRATHGSDGKLWLQYWVWYYYNDGHKAGLADHEGDWELVQVGLDSTLAPDVATYAQHDHADRCPWPYVDKKAGTTDVPIAYIEDGSHAAHFKASTPGPGWDGLFRPELSVRIIEDASPSWVAWPGRWGEQTGTFLRTHDSPTAPSGQGDRWSDPSAFNAGAELGYGCGIP